MKKTIISFLIVFLISLAAQAQKKDTLSKAQDTVKSAVYYITGNMQTFQLLYLLVTSPGDITPNQIKALEEWIRNNVKQLIDKSKNKIP